MTEAERARDAAIELVAAPAAEWIARVVAMIRAQGSGTLLTTDDLWGALGDDRPSEPRAMGAAVKHAAELNLIRSTGGYRKSSRPRCHARPVAIWVRV